MKNIILILMVIGIAGCATAPPYTGPSLSVPAEGVGGAHHRVEAGQTLWKISKLYDVDIDDIIRLNHISKSSVVEAGQVLLIPNRLRPQNISIKSGGDDFIWPLRGRVIAGFGFTYHNLINKGINIQAPAGSDILATRGGRVVFSSNNFGNYGKTIIIDHGDGLCSVYSRASEILVQPGENVQRGGLVGRVGTSARDKNSYLHFEIRKGAMPQNPLFYLS
ncbi:MAG: LysM peptidoglycan-binding domain-containing M23 family metallopeptidase [Candidatus Omnitrophica bacterium]|nr:LysM peptidoglycan-binding domain-containing M23 family metallopeptidase [Candidatus Omnitrophota bacterium]MBU4303536.1 LysM peptidoglycan-binding domain-containing M23 family metallopeptidase [Candidatus Omnitrophota bacterium]MBU4468278.1 LysM peptidoglycan-binding domain-containing M23 family metallopeptidase [Candidatus Omnitrophota bacterium]MCG2708583.1 LysM peptidoglycan-binding domain-containing M23 family metallopeptidase [Candidatus Omnitrophota bacterium]